MKKGLKNFFFLFIMNFGCRSNYMVKKSDYFLDKLQDKKYSSYLISEKQIAVGKLYNFFNNLEKLKNYEESNGRKLSKIDMFLYAYVNTVSKPKDHEDDNTSHDLVGTLLTGKSVCQGYTSLLEFICNELDIPFLYKVTEGPFGAHGNFQVIVDDEDGIKHCLHCDPFIDSKDNENNSIGLNAVLIPADDINNYHNHQDPSSQFLFWELAFNSMTVEEKKKQLDSLSFLEKLRNESEETAIKKHYEYLKNNILELNKFFRIELEELDSNDKIINAYRTLKEYYSYINVPIDREVIYSHINKLLVDVNIAIRNINVTEAVLYAENDLNKIIEETKLRYKTKWIK